MSNICNHHANKGIWNLKIKDYKLFNVDSHLLINCGNTD